MKKIITSLGMLVFVGALVVGATGAFFSDTETSTGNVFTAGAIDLKIDNSSYGFDWNRPDVEDPTGVWGPNQNNSWALSDLTGQLFFDFEDLKPGDYGEDTISLHVQNDAWACMAVNLTGKPDNGINDPEAGADDITDGAQGGELQNYLEFVFWKDDGDNVLEVGEQIIPALTGLAKDIFTGAKLAIADASTVGGPLLANEEGEASYIGKGWCFGDLTTDPEVAALNPNGPTPGNTGFNCSGAGNHNIAQTDGIVVDVTFDAVQARNNDRFLCNPVVVPETASLTVIKHVVLNDQSSADDDITASDFLMSVKDSVPANVTGSPQAGAEAPGFTLTGLAAGTYTVSESGPITVEGLEVVVSYSGNCSSDTIVLAPGDAKTCTVTNTYVLD